MGSYSESCGFSGLEIGEGEVAYVCLLGAPKYRSGHGSFSLFEPKTTLIRGAYNDYGYLRIEDDNEIIALFNEQSGLDLKNGDDFALDHIDGRAEVDRWWMHGSMFDFVPAIRPEFPYSWAGGKSQKIKNIGEATDLYFARAENAIAHARSELEELKKIDDFELLETRIAMSLTKSTITDALGGYSETRGLDRAKLLDLVCKGKDVSAHLAGWRRIWTLEYAMNELRKKIVPSEGIGPQHCGEFALDQFAKHLRTTIRERKRRWDKE